MFTLLNLSDLHRSTADPISNSELVSALIADLQRFPHEKPCINTPDAVIVSGDLVRGVSLGVGDYPTALALQYEEALEFLITVAGVFVGGDRSRVVIVPGNHDVDWNMARKAMVSVDMDNKDIRALLEAPGSRYRQCWKTRQLFEITNTALYDQRFEYFAATYERFYNGARLAYAVDPRRAWNLFSLDNGRIIVAGFNSCVSSDCFNPYGEIPATAISESHLEMLSVPSNPELRLAVWHHDVEGPPQRSDYMDQDTVRLMIDKGYRLGLHGHQHKSASGPHVLVTSERQVMAVISAGSLCAAKKSKQWLLNRLSPSEGIHSG